MNDPRREGIPMSDSLPKPLSSINALRAHLKVLERGVDNARNKRVGTSEQPASLAPVTRPSQQAATRTMSPPPASYPMTRPTSSGTGSGSDGKPKAKPKSGTDFSAFFGGIDKRAAS